MFELQGGKPALKPMYYGTGALELASLRAGTLKLCFGTEEYDEWDVENDSALNLFLMEDLERFRTYVINTLMTGPSAMITYCEKHDAIQLGMNYGLYCLSEDYSYFVRCCPESIAEHNLVAYVYPNAEMYSYLKSQTKQKFYR